MVTIVILSTACFILGLICLRLRNKLVNEMRMRQLDNHIRPLIEKVKDEKSYLQALGALDIYSSISVSRTVHKHWESLWKLLEKKKKNALKSNSL